MTLLQTLFSLKGRLLGNKIWLYMILAFIVPFLEEASLGFYLLYKVKKVEINNFLTPFLQNPVWIWIVLVLITKILFCIWLIVKCGFLKGTDGDNQYSPKPLSIKYLDQAKLTVVQTLFSFKGRLLRNKIWLCMILAFIVPLLEEAGLGSYLLYTVYKVTVESNNYYYLMTLTSLLQDSIWIWIVLVLIIKIPFCIWLIVERGFLKGVVQTLFSFKGRLRRQTFWLWYLPMWLIVDITLKKLPAYYMWYYFFIHPKPPLSVLSMLYITFVTSVFSWILIPLTIKRLHDLNKSGWWVLISFIPIIGLIWFIICCCRRGTSDNNKYGPNPIIPGGEKTSNWKLLAIIITSILLGILNVSFTSVGILNVSFTSVLLTILNVNGISYIISILYFVGLTLA